MGTTFRHMADGALAPCGGHKCHHCERTDVPIYTYHGRILNPALAKDVDLARRDPDVDELCADCILGGNVCKDNVTVKEILRTIESFAADKQRVIEEYHRMPHLPFFQGEVWPMCCGDLTEYIGDHPSSGTSYGDYQPWQPMDTLVARFKLEDFYPLEKLPVMYTMALFRCLHCPKRYWVFQYSGLFWRGPLIDQRR